MARYVKCVVMNTPNLLLHCKNRICVLRFAFLMKYCLYTCISIQLENGQVVVAPSSLIKRLPQHYVTLPWGLEILLGRNGYIWIQRKPPSFPITPRLVCLVTVFYLILPPS
jgi:hypothetical protein